MINPICYVHGTICFEVMVNIRNNNLSGFHQSEGYNLYFTTSPYPTGSNLCQNYQFHISVPTGHKEITSGSFYIELYTVINFARVCLTLRIFKHMQFALKSAKTTMQHTTSIKIKITS